MLSDHLPRDLAEDVLSRVPVTSMRAVRSVSKKWNTLCKGQSFAPAKSAVMEGESVVVMVINCRVYLMSVNLYGIHNNVDPSINRQGKLVSLTDSGQVVGICVVYHCDGLLLCITEDCTRFVVWNPYCCQNRWFKPKPTCQCKLGNSRYAIGYENSKSCRKYKVLRFCEHSGYVTYEVYNVNYSTSSRDIISIRNTICPDWEIASDARGLSLKGNTYWFAQNRSCQAQGSIFGFLLCFDFSAERFGPRLSLPFQSADEDTVTLSSVRDDEQLAVLFQRWDNLHMEIWITTKIDPQAVSWSNKVFLAVDMSKLTPRQFGVSSASFLVDEENKVVVVFDSERQTEQGNVGYIMGQDGYFKTVDFGEPPEYLSYDNLDYQVPIMCSYVPSLVQIKRPAQQGGKTKKRRRPAQKA